MDSRDVRSGEIYWWKFHADERVLVRVVLVGREFVSCKVLSATAEQVLACGYGAGEIVNTKHNVLELVPGG